MVKDSYDDEKWIKDTALLFYQIFSVDYEESFTNRLLAGGGGNSTLCATWIHLSDAFVPYRISEDAYKSLIKKIDEIDRGKIRIVEDKIYIPKYINKKYHSMFYNNAKGAENRKKAGKFFHFDHNPSNKKVLEILSSTIKEHKNDNGYLEVLADYIKNIQTIDLITVDEDDIRTWKDRSDGAYSAAERDKMLKTKFYKLIFE